MYMCILMRNINAIYYVIVSFVCLASMLCAGVHIHVSYTSTHVNTSLRVHIYEAYTFTHVNTSFSYTCIVQELFT